MLLDLSPVPVFEKKEKKKKKRENNKKNWIATYPPLFYALRN